ncbi:hypothetical protein KEM54_002208 [Ascosphaera aggregata]|nr:hypothetical protein KEM54_002208 [Ascosphaera aggregata]
MDTYVAAPFFGPNVWNATIEPVTGGNLPQSPSSSFSLPTLKLTFKDGGAFDFQSDFELIKERLLQIIEESGETPQSIAMASGIVPVPAAAAAAAGSATTAGRFNYAAVNMDPLPAYEEGNGIGLGLGLGLGLGHGDGDGDGDDSRRGGGCSDCGGLSTPLAPPMHYVQHTWTPNQVPAYDDSGAVTTTPVQSLPYNEALMHQQHGQGHGQGQGQAPVAPPDDPPPGV